jgi:hypothetical protein
VRSLRGKLKLTLRDHKKNAQLNPGRKKETNGEIYSYSYSYLSLIFCEPFVLVVTNSNSIEQYTYPFCIRYPQQLYKEFKYICISSQGGPESLIFKCICILILII